MTIDNLDKSQLREHFRSGRVRHPKEGDEALLEQAPGETVGAMRRLATDTVELAAGTCRRRTVVAASVCVGGLATCCLGVLHWGVAAAGMGVFLCGGGLLMRALDVREESTAHSRRVLETLSRLEPGLAHEARWQSAPAEVEGLLREEPVHLEEDETGVEVGVHYLPYRG